MKYLLASVLIAILPAHAEPIDFAQAAETIVVDANKVRRANGLPALAAESRLAKAARDFAEYMARTDNLSHEADGRQPADRAKRHGYDYCMVAENIGYQYRSDGFRSVAQLAEGFVRGWENSPEHRKNMLDAEAVETELASREAARPGGTTRSSSSDGPPR
jgi:uncharacterized protein YkwD